MFENDIEEEMEKFWANPEYYAGLVAEFIRNDSQRRASSVDFRESHHLTRIHYALAVEATDYLLNLLSSTPRNSPRNFSVAAHKGKLHFTDHFPDLKLVEPIGADLDAQITWLGTIVCQMESEITDGPQGFRADLNKLSRHKEIPLISLMFGRAQNESQGEKLHDLVRRESEGRKEPFISIIQILRSRQPISNTVTSVRVYFLRSSKLARSRNSNFCPTHANLRRQAHQCSA